MYYMNVYRCPPKVLYTFSTYKEAARHKDPAFSPLCVMRVDERTIAFLPYPPNEPPKDPEPLETYDVVLTT